MTSQFQNRLVGTIVLVALGVIFLPDMLDGKQSRVEEVFTEIPLRNTKFKQSEPVNREPASDVFDKDDNVQGLELGAEDEEERQVQLEGTSPPLSNLKPIKMVDTTVNKTAANSAGAKTPAPVTQKPKVQDKPPVIQVKRDPIVKAPIPNNKPLPGVTLQLGGFNSAGNVIALVAQLRKAGFTAYTLPVKPVDGRLTKVFVGPEVSEDKLKTRQVQIEKLTGLKGKIVPYNPLDN